MSSYRTISCTTLSSKQQGELLFIISLGGVVSAIFCLAALLLVACLKLHKRFSHRLAAYQVVSSLFFSVVCSVQMVVLHLDSSSGIYARVCEALGFLLEYAVWVKMLVMLWLTIHLFSFVVCYTGLGHREVLCALTVTLFPLLFVWIPFVNGMYGLAGGWCWIQNWKNDCMTDTRAAGEIEQYGLFYVPAFIFLVVAILLIIIMLIVMLRRLKLSSSSEVQPLIDDTRRKRAVRELLPLVAYPVLFCLFLFPPFINRVYGDIAKANMATFTSSAVAVSSLGSFAGLTLIAHVLVLKWPRTLSCITTNGHAVDGDRTLPNDCGGNTPQYTSYTIGSTNYRTGFSVPNESDVDNSLLGTPRVTNTNS